MTGYLSPNQIVGFDSWLKKNDFYWIEKRHSADTNDPVSSLHSSSNFLILNHDFDVSILYDHVDMVITDYSSVSTDALYKFVQTLEYCPDYNEYKENDRGFVNDFCKYHVFEPVINSNLLLKEIEKRIKLNPKNTPKYIATRDFLFGETQIQMNHFVEKLIGKKSRMEEK